MKRSPPWTPQEYATLYRCRQANMPVCEIAQRVGRSVWAVRTKLLNPDRRVPSSYRIQVEGQRYQASHDALDDRERRREALEQQTLTQAFCGDPPPGFSALERGVKPVS